jgi:protein SCO1/2
VRRHFGAAIEKESPMNPKPRAAIRGVVGAILLALSISGLAADEGPRFTRSEVEIDIPPVILINQKGDTVDLRTQLKKDEPVLVDFMFATCTTICPVLSAGYANIQRELVDSPDQVHLISISIDPEHDGPEEMTAYLERYRAKPGWDFLTGTRDDIDRVMKAFDAFVPDKMSHRPLMFIRMPEGNRWVRIHGFARGADLMKEIRQASEDPSPEVVQ